MARPELSTADLRIIEEEQRLLEKVKDAISEAPFRDRNNGQLRERLLTLREEMHDAMPSDLPGIHNQLHELRSVAERRLQSPLPDLRVPYFAHMQLETEQGQRDVLLGRQSFIDPHSGVTIVDWRIAPIAKVFFQGVEGDDYEAKLPGRVIEGVLRKRRILTLDEGELVHISGSNGDVRKDSSGAWRHEAGMGMPELSGGEGGDAVKRIIGTGLAGRKNPVIASLLDDAQYAAVTSDPSKPVLVLGSAGCGKTTVALHRLSYLSRNDPVPPSEMLAIVPEEGLVRLTRMLLAELELEQVAVMTADGWFAEQGQRLFPELPDRPAVNTPAVVMRMKRHAAMASVLPFVADRAGRKCAQRMDAEIDSEGALLELYTQSGAETPLARLEEAVSRYCEGDKRSMKLLFDKERERFERIDEDRVFLLSNPELAQQVVESAGRDLPLSSVKRLLLHTQIQLSPTTEEKLAHVPAERRRTADGRAIDTGTPTEDAGSIDAEDFPLLLALHQLKTGRAMSVHGRLDSYRHLVIDEAQELSHVELQVLGQALAQGGTVTVAGDPAQQIDESTSFDSWGMVIDALGVDQAEPTVLETSYRCTQPIADFGHQILGCAAPAEAPRASKRGSPVARSQFRNEMHAAAFMAEALIDLLQREPEAQVGILLREWDRAERIHRSLPKELRARLVAAGDFRFQPGIEVATVRQVKGLEFDYVIIPDASAQTYPDDSLSRRTLHVASTRAIHQLWVISTGSPSPLLPPG